MGSSDMTKKKIQIRKANEDDWEILLEWRNDIETRSASNNTELVSEERHINWLRSVVQDPDRLLYIAEQSGDPVGTVRADFSKNICELSWTVAPPARGKGIGKEMVYIVALMIPNQLYAEVKNANPASMRIAKYCGMYCTHQDNELSYFKRDEVLI